MARNGSGVYSLPAGNPVVTGTTISSTWANTTLTDISTALTGSLASDGQTAPTANLPMGGNVHTNVGNATARTNYSSAADVQDGSLTYLTTVSGTDTITASAAPALPAYAAGQTFRFVAAGNTATAGSFVTGRSYVIVSVGTTDFTLIGASANTVGVFFVATGAGSGTGTASTGNTTTSVTLNVNSLGAKSVTRLNGAPLAVGDIPSGALVTVGYDGTKFQLQSSVGVSSFSAGATGLTPSTATTGAVTLAGVLGKLNGGTGALTATISFVSRATNVVTITTAGVHNFAVGDYVTVAAVTNTGFNGNFTIASTPTTTTFTYAQTGSTVGTTADTGTVTDLSYVNLATNVTGTLYPNFGGTGTTTLPTGNIIVGNATSAVSSIAPASNGQSLIVTAGTSTSIGSLVPGASYTIATVGTGNWTSIGASAATVGVTFVCNSTTQTGTGSATLNTWTAGSGIATSTSVSTTSGSSIDFTNIPSWVKRITVMLNGVTSSNAIEVRLGTSSGIVATGYNGGAGIAQNGNSTSVGSTSTGFSVSGNTSTVVGIWTIANFSGNTWTAAWNWSNSGNQFGGGGAYIALSGVLTQLRLSAGSGTFSAGSINILYE